MQGYSVIEASGSVVGATGAAVNCRGAVPARTGAGVYTLTLDRPLNAGDGIVLITARGGAPTTAFGVAHTSDSVKTVSSVALAAGQAATDANFDFLVVRMAVGANF